ncbi:uncharacterized protein VTP21DRAFT_2220 [Calcarisporiella thermophila]|uniref:uncharacterized protein n=1 Tax=Calcarisporiella thermophila TaxID=911321 RepID=UPI003743476B
MMETCGGAERRVSIALDSTDNFIALHFKYGHYRNTNLEKQEKSSEYLSKNTQTPLANLIKTCSLWSRRGEANLFALRDRVSWMVLPALNPSDASILPSRISKAYSFYFI